MIRIPVSTALVLISFCTSVSSSVEPDSPARLPEPLRDSLAGGGQGPELVALPAGRFVRGDLQGTSTDADEKPPTDVTLSRPFAIGVYEVTFDEFDAFCDATGRAKPDDSGRGRGRRPVVNVTWNDAVAYTRWLSEQTGRVYRLPTDAEWEYAASPRDCRRVLRRAMRIVVPVVV